MKKTYQRIIFGLFILVSFIFVSANVWASGPACGSFTNRSTCDTSHSCCEWWDSTNSCHASPAGSSGVAGRQCAAGIVCQTSSNDMMTSVCDGVGADCGGTVLYNCSIFTCAYQGTTCANQQICGDRIPQSNEQCDDGVPSETFTAPRIRDLFNNAPTGTYWSIIADGLQTGSSADAYCKSKGWDKALTYTNITVPASTNRAIYSQVAGLTNAQVLHVNDSVVWGSSGLGITYVDWYNTGIFITAPYLTIIQTLTCTNDASKKANGVSCTSPGCTYCNSTCSTVTVDAASLCGNSNIDGSEQCDGINLNSQSCATLGLLDNPASINKVLKCNVSSCKFDLSGCYGISGWKLLGNTAWTTTVDNALSVTMPGEAVSTFSFDLKTGVNYGLNYITTKDNAACTVTFDLNDNNCTSFSTFTTKRCFNIGAFSDTLGVSGTRLVAYNFNLSDNADATNGLFKDVKLRITVSGTAAACSGILVQNISLKETTSADNNIYFDASQINNLGTTYTSGCCPIDYCWNGSSCLDSALWRTNSSYPPVWNNIWIDNLTDNHVNTWNQSSAVGYRCIIINDSSREAQWVPSLIKYDWNFEKSGYCMDSTDCFVNESFNASLKDKGLYGNYSLGCVRNGDIVASTSSNSIGTGNHYCYFGNWTTRSYIIAKLLQNLSSNNAYTLHCYDDTSLVYNKVTANNGGDNILSACVIVIKKAPNNEQVITGLVLKDDAQASTFVGDVQSEYTQNYPFVGSNKFYDATDCTSNTSTTVVAGTNFSICAEQSGNTNGGGLFLYYEMTHRYFVLSDKVVAFTKEMPFWDSIIQFFKRLLFGSTDFHTTPYEAISYTTNYDRIYVMQNGTLNVTGLEESKYDEGSGHVANILYVKYSGSNTTNNPINSADIFANISHTATNAGTSNLIPVQMNTTSNAATQTQEVIIKTENKTGLWSYFTSFLRNRQP